MNVYIHEYRINDEVINTISQLETMDEENILLKTYGTCTYAYCKRRNLYIYIGAYDDDVVARKHAI